MPTPSTRVAPSFAGSAAPEGVSRAHANPSDMTIRWDRLGRAALLFVLVGLLALYVRPALSYVATWRQASAQRAQVDALEREHARLEARRAALRRPATIEREARKIGYVKRGERAYVIEDLPAG